ncbi:hypothetical protein TIFTF001_004121 [Ficus carica]|uniref:Uncharacterized protein n=1 Tax=Ficus carica TaxID=3494 RepID=A0AA87ZBW7_FICCA|nr:hypothetical protein TIFTF001_004121 [Ficus carica]
MSDPIVLSDEDETPFLSKKRRTGPEQDRNPIPTVVVLDDDSTPQKPGPTSSPVFVPETPLSDISIIKFSRASSSDHPRTAVPNPDRKFSEMIVPETPMSDVAIVKCSRASSSDHSHTTVLNSDRKFSDSGINRLIFLESDNESEGGSDRENWKESETMDSGFNAGKDLDCSTRFTESTSTLGHGDAIQMAEDNFLGPTSLENDVLQARDGPEDENVSMDQMEDNLQKKKTNANTEKKNSTTDTIRRKKMTEEEKIHLKEEKKLKKLQEKLQKDALKAEAAELKKIEKEKKKWENGKFAVQSIVAEIDAKVIEIGSVGGSLLTRFSEKGLKYRITSNPIAKTILWTMKYPEHISEEVSSRLREQGKYKNPTTSSGWRRPPVEEALAKLTTHFVKVHSRQCVDEAELAEHVVGLTCSLASCQFRKKLTRLSVNANGSLVPKDSVDKNLIKNNLWLKALVAIPKVQPRFAVAIWKKYPTMKLLLSVYMDPSKSVHEKEFLLKDLKIEGLLGEDRRLGAVCSKRVYRILMAQSGSIKTDDVEDGADFFGHQSS